MRSSRLERRDDRRQRTTALMEQSRPLAAATGDAAMVLSGAGNRTDNTADEQGDADALVAGLGA